MKVVSSPTAIGTAWVSKQPCIFSDDNVSQIDEYDAELQVDTGLTLTLSRNTSRTFYTLENGVTHTYWEPNRGLRLNHYRAGTLLILQGTIDVSVDMDNLQIDHDIFIKLELKTDDVVFPKPKR